jgi:hypothetical protein
VRPACTAWRELAPQIVTGREPSPEFVAPGSGAPSAADGPLPHLGPEVASTVHGRRSTTRAITAPTE